MSVDPAQSPDVSKVASKRLDELQTQKQEAQDRCNRILHESIQDGTLRLGEATDKLDLLKHGLSDPTSIQAVNQLKESLESADTTQFKTAQSISETVQAAFQNRRTTQKEDPTHVNPIWEANPFSNRNPFAPKPIEQTCLENGGEDEPETEAPKQRKKKPGQFKFPILTRLIGYFKK